MRFPLLRKLFRPSGEPTDFKFGRFLWGLAKWTALYVLFASAVIAALTLLQVLVKRGPVDASASFVQTPLLVLNPVLVGIAWWAVFKNYRNPIGLWWSTFGVMFVLITTASVFAMLVVGPSR